MRALQIDAHDKVITECEIEQDDNVLISEYAIVHVPGLSGKDALYTMTGVDPLGAIYKVKGLLITCRGTGFVLGHTIDGEITAAKTTLKSLKRLVAFP